MKKIIYILIVLGMLISVIPTSASGCTVKISDLKVTESQVTVPSTIGITAKITGNDLQKVVINVINSKTNEIETYTDIDCKKCISTGICSRSVIVKDAGSYNVEVKAYGKSGCFVSFTKHNVITVKDKVKPNDDVIDETDDNVTDNTIVNEIDDNETDINNTIIDDSETNIDDVIDDDETNVDDEIVECNIQPCKSCINKYKPEIEETNFETNINNHICHCKCKCNC
jgi:hypothetical protein